jgi:LmbE family N-acetylglucosaminyl deacetylase
MVTPAALAIAAHPDDIEFLMAGTLRRLKDLGWRTHCFTVANGSCGSLTLGPAAIARVRAREAKAAAKVLGATFHASLTDDCTILYGPPLLRRIAALVRQVAPTVLLVPSPQDYMEDHTETCRLAVTAAFVRGMPNFRTTPRRKPIAGDVTIYHAMPHGLRDPLGNAVVPHAFVDTTAVHEIKRQALSAHKSQLGFLADTQHMSSYVVEMDQMSRAMGAMSGAFTHAEGWRKHLYRGFCAEDADPLAEALGRSYRVVARGRA